MKATVPQATVAQARVARVDVGRVTIGTITVGQLQVTNAKLGISAGQAQLHNVTVTIELDFKLKWRIGIDGPGPLDLNESGTNSLGGVDIPFALGDAEILALRNINLNIADLTAAQVKTNADPVSGIRLTGLAAEGVHASDVTVPSAGFEVPGLGLTALQLNAVDVPAATVGSAAVARLRGDPLSLPALRLTGLHLPAASAGDITSGALDIPVRRRDPIELPGLDIGFFAASLIIDSGARMHVDSMLMTGVRAGADVDAIVLRNVTLPFEAADITLSDLGIDTIDVPTIGVA